MRQTKPDSTTGVGALQEQNSQHWGRAGEGRRPVTRHDSWATAVAPCPCSRVFAADLLFLFNAFSWDFFGGLLIEY